MRETFTLVSFEPSKGSHRRRRHIYLKFPSLSVTPMFKRCINSCPTIKLHWLVAGFVGELLIVCYQLSASFDQQLLTYNLEFLQNQVSSVYEKLSPSLACPTASQSQRKFIILYWTKYYHVPDFGNVGLGGKPFGTCDPGCMATTDRNLLNESDAIIFHFRTLNVSDMPPPAWRRPHQHFIFFEVESPVHTYLPALRWPLLKSYFNRTMTYRRDSDVVYLEIHGRVRCINSSTSCLDFPLASKSDIPNVDDPADHFPINLTLKNRTAAWFVSNCHSDGVGGSRREFMVRNISQFIPVDIYGGCATEEAKKCPNRPVCNPMLSQYYRFYFCFENSLCPDYVTEKCYRPLAFDTVPVVYGGSDYSLFFPAGSYINAMDFDSPESLANYLKKLMTDDELYLSYFRWRRKYVVDLAPKDSWCQFCQMLRNAETKTYDDIGAWWSGESINQTCSLSPPKSLVGAGKS